MILFHSSRGSTERTPSLPLIRLDGQFSFYFLLHSFAKTYHITFPLELPQPVTHRAPASLYSTSAPQASTFSSFVSPVIRNVILQAHPDLSLWQCRHLILVVTDPALSVPLHTCSTRRHTC